MTGRGPWLEWWRRLPRLHRIGWLLYGMSMLTPSADLKSLGVFWFILLPTAAFTFFAQHPADPMLGIWALIGVAANLFAFVRIPWPVCLVAVAAPFGAFLWMNSGNGFGIMRGLIGLPFFYPWAAGLVLLNIGRARLKMTGVNAAGEPRRP